MESASRNGDGRAELAIVIVSANDAQWLDDCLSSVFASAGGVQLDVVVVDNESSDGTRELIESRFPEARVLASPNLGFAYGNNRGIETTTAPYVLLLNPDTKVLQGSFGDLIAALKANPDIGIAGVRQVSAGGKLWPTMRRFPSFTRALGEALFSERWPVHPAWAGERVLEPSAYESEGECDWLSGSFMLLRREAFLSAGFLDERFFLYSEEPDLCLRVKRAGWKICYLPQVTILHHAGKGGVRPQMIAQEAYARRQYASKHFGRLYRFPYLLACGLRHIVRAAVATGPGRNAAASRRASIYALKALTRRGAPPFCPPPSTAFMPVDNRPRTLVSR